jgi:hypothetical protein
VAESVARFDTPVQDRRGRLYDAKACGSERDDGLWEGWIEFESRDTGEVLRTSRETTQPNLKDLRYWATGLTPVFLQGALERILYAPQPRPVRPLTPPTFDGPAERLETKGRHTMRGDAVLNPFSVYEKSPDLLAQELTALRGWHLRQILRDYNLVADGDARLDSLSDPELGSLILQRVRELYP